MNFSKEELMELAEKMDGKDFVFLACAYLMHIKNEEINFYMNNHDGHYFVGRIQYLPEKAAIDKIREYGNDELLFRYYN